MQHNNIIPLRNYTTSNYFNCETIYDVRLLLIYAKGMDGFGFL